VAAIAVVSMLGHGADPQILIPSSSSPGITSASSSPDRCELKQLSVTASAESGARRVGRTGATNPDFAKEIIGRVHFKNPGPTCALSGHPDLTIQGKGGQDLGVPTSYDPPYCILSCGTQGRPVVLQSGESAVVGYLWQPSYCGDRTAKNLALRIAVADGQTTTPIVQAPTADSNVDPYPDCASGVAEGALTVEGFAGTAEVPHE
jgi:hypothetical protein